MFTLGVEEENGCPQRAECCSSSSEGQQNYVGTSPEAEVGWDDTEHLGNAALTWSGGAQRLETPPKNEFWVSQGTGM